MDFNDGMQPMIWRDRANCKDMKQIEIIASMLAEADSEGYEPMDFNYAGVPNIYLRSKYSYEYDDDGKFKPETEQWITDGFAMFVRKKAE